MSRSVLKSVVFSSALLMSGAAFAAPILISTQVNGSYHGSYGSASVNIDSATNPDVTINGASAGAFALTGDLDGNGPAENFAAFCLDIAHYLSLPGYYTITTSPFASDPLTTTQIGNVQTLFDMAFGSLTLTSNAQSAGFQLALWEIIYETTGTLSVGNGNFTASGNTGAVNFANTLLGNLVSAGPVTQVYNLTCLESQNGQDLVTASPVPLPAAGLLLLAALGGLGLARRRKTV